MNVCPSCNHQGEERVCPHDGFPMVDADRYGPRHDDLVGRVFEDKYEIDALLGRGGMGAVWRARHRVMHHAVALKVMRHDVDAGLNAVKRFYNEARACCRLRHPNTIRVTDFGATSDGYLYMAMELLEGKDLAAYLAEGPLPPQRALRILAQVCKSLDEAHEAGMVHRDLKPSNVFLTEIHGEADFVKVIDFGIAKAVGGDGSASQNLTQTGLVVGTPRYIAPEQIRGEAVDRRADLYAVGILLHEVLTGTIPFDAKSTSALLLAHATETPHPLPERLSGVPTPDRLRALHGRLLAKSVAHRPATAADVARELLATADELSGAAAASVTPTAPPAFAAPAATAALERPETLVVPETQALPENAARAGTEPAPGQPAAALRDEAAGPRDEPPPVVRGVETSGFDERRAPAPRSRPWWVYAGIAGVVAVVGTIAVASLSTPADRAAPAAQTPGPPALETPAPETPALTTAAPAAPSPDVIATALVTGAPDVSEPPDVSAPPDVAAMPDVVTPPDVAAMPDVAARPDVAPPPVDVATAADGPIDTSAAAVDPAEPTTAPTVQAPPTPKRTRSTRRSRPTKRPTAPRADEPAAKEPIPKEPPRKEPAVRIDYDL